MFIIIITLLILIPDLSQASVTGACANCHVMHASQVASGLGISTPRDGLLKDTCLACHTGTNTGGTTPYIYTSGTEELAAGNFKYSDVNDERNGHNPLELGSTDSVLTGNPPGWINTGFAANGQVGGSSPAWSSNLSCSGTYGCHGKHIANGIFGAHHNHPTTGALTTADTVGNSYRFLYGIRGYEDSDYEYQGNGTDGQHNVYLGVARSGNESSADSPTNTHTMSYLCAECHGIFHSGINNNKGVSDNGDTFFSDPWIRHPVDISMPIGTSGNAYYYTAYNITTPVASTDVSNSAVDMTSASDRIVMCLSCHRAHASPNYASLRWDYQGAAGSWVNGCANCHTDKN